MTDLTQNKPHLTEYLVKIHYTLIVTYYWSIIIFLVISSFFHKLQKIPSKIKEKLKNTLEKRKYD